LQHHSKQIPVKPNFREGIPPSPERKMPRRSPPTVTRRSFTMPSKHTISPTKRLAQLKERMAVLQQEQERTCRNLAQELSECLITAGSLEVDFDTLIGGILDVIAEARTNSSKAEGWKKSGGMFRQQWRQNRDQLSGSGNQNSGARGRSKSKNQESIPKTFPPQPEKSPTLSGA